MSTNARSWFYSTPEPRPFYIEERVNQTLWRNRLQTLYMTCTKASAPYQMEGTWQGIPVTFEWQPGKYFILRLGQQSNEFIGVMRQILMMRPALSYEDSEGFYVVEWHTDGGAQRYQQLSSASEYQSLLALRDMN
jgi:hypothetical protein